jgi:LPS sulfotransferase NodH
VRSTAPGSYSSDKAFGIEKTLFICFVNRSGSNYLVEGLKASGELTGGNEFFLKVWMERLCKEHSLDTLEDYCRYIIRRFGQPDKALCVKIGWQMLYFLGAARILYDVFPAPRFVIVRRRDLMAQAVSYDLDLQRKKWKSTQEGNITESIRFDPVKVARRVGTLAQSLSYFYTYMALFGHDYYECCLRGVWK